MGAQLYGAQRNCAQDGHNQGLMTYEKELNTIANKIVYLIGKYYDLLGANDRRASFFTWNDETNYFWGKTTKKNIGKIKRQADENAKGESSKHRLMVP